VSEYTVAGVLTIFEHGSGAGVDFSKGRSGAGADCRLFFYKSCHSVTLKCTKLLHRKSQNFIRLECKPG